MRTWLFVCIAIATSSLVAHAEAPKVSMVSKVATKMKAPVNRSGECTDGKRRAYDVMYDLMLDTLNANDTLVDRMQMLKARRKTFGPDEKRRNEAIDELWERLAYEQHPYRRASVALDKTRMTIRDRRLPTICSLYALQVHERLVRTYRTVLEMDMRMLHIDEPLPRLFLVEAIRAEPAAELTNLQLIQIIFAPTKI